MPAVTMFMTKRDEAKDCLLSALVGDRAGATLEFLVRKHFGMEVERVLGMIGGRLLRTVSVQITDDEELTQCLARALSGRQGDEDRSVGQAGSRARQGP